MYENIYTQKYIFIFRVAGVNGPFFGRNPSSLLIARSLALAALAGVRQADGELIPR